MRIAENFTRNNLKVYDPDRWDNLYRVTISDDLLAAAAVGDTVYISLLLDAREPIPRIRVHDLNGSKALSIGEHYLQNIPQGFAWYTVQSTIIEGKDRSTWVIDITDTINEVGNGYDMDLLQVIVSLTPSDIWTPAHADLTPEQIATLPPYGEYKEIKSF